jgi:hypothetical protein
MSDQYSPSWFQRLVRHVRRRVLPSDGPPGSSESAVVPTEVSSPHTAGPRSIEDWRELVRPGRRITLSWDGGPRRGTLMAQGEVRLTFEDTIWIWLDRDLPPEDRPTTGQAIQVMAPRDDAMRVIPCRLVDEGRGSSFQVVVCGRVTRVQRRDDVRARVDLPPVSAVKLGVGDRPIGLLGLEVVDLSAGGVRLRGHEALTAGDRLRCMLRLDNGEPLTPLVEVLVGGTSAHGRFAPMPERDRRRIVQYVYRQELAERRRLQSAAPVE